MTNKQAKKVINWVTKGLSCTLLLSLLACQPQNQRDNTIQEVSDSSSEEIEGRLVLKNATLEQSDEQGNTLWKIQAQEAVYSEDKETAQLEDLKGHLFRDGEVVMQVSAKQGTILEDGKKILLKEQIVAVDPRNKVVIKGEEVEWLTQEDVLIVKQKITGDHPQLRASAQQGKYFTGEQRLELKGKIIATTKEPPLQMKTEELSWQIAQKKVIGNKPLRIDRYDKNTVTDRILTDTAEINLGTNIAILRNNIELKSLKPRLQIATNSAVWNIKQRLVSSDTPIQIVHPQEKITLSANQGAVDLTKETVSLKGGVRGISLTNKGDLYANQMMWDIPTQIVEAQGNVIYKQTNPQFNLNGATAVGRLQDQSIVVSGGEGEGSTRRVVTEIIP